MKEYNSFSEHDLTVVICAYKVCDDLENTIESIIRQTKLPNILISTSTPNEYILKLADKYNIEVRVNPNGGQINDYNFALAQVDTKLGMIAHQDDPLKDTFVEENIKYLNCSKDPIIAFSDYLEMHNEIVDKKPSPIIRVKHILVWPLKTNLAKKGGFKRFCQLLGNPITHPTVVCVMDKMPKEIFRQQYKASMDWDLWERLSRLKGSFVYVPSVQLYHRMAEENQTVQLYKSGENYRYNEELEIFSRFWPKWIAKIIMMFYKRAERYY